MMFACTSARPRARAASALAGVLLAIACGLAAAADLDLGQAEQLVRQGRFQDAYELLAPLEAQGAKDARYNYLLGRAALETKRNDRAKAALERSLKLDPDSPQARLALGRAYFALGMFAEATIEFETVLTLDNLPPDLESRAEIYNEAAAEYLAGRRLLPFGYAEVGVGRYRTNSNATTAFFEGDRSETFYNARVGGGLAYVLDDDYTVNASLDYRFRYYDNPDTRNDSDWRWNAALTRALDENSLTGGVRGRVSYRGDGIYRNDYGVFGQWRRRLDEDNQISFGAELRRRDYGSSRLSDRSRSIAELNAGWTRALFGGSGSFSLVGHGGYQFATSRDDGNSNFFGATATVDFTLTDTLGGFVFAWWERDLFNVERLHFHPDALEGAGVNQLRKDDLYEIGGGLVWAFAKGWSLRPEILWIRDTSNAFANNYESTEFWINVRKGF
jgi:tetratricopeptide (TPR) repeat protein